MEVEAIAVSGDEGKDADTNELNSSKESESENLDDIRKFIADHANISDSIAKTENSDPEKKPDELEDVKEPATSEEKEDKATQEIAKTKEQNATEKELNGKMNIDEVIDVDKEDEKVAVASNVMNMILSESEAQIAKKRDSKGSPKQVIATGEKGQYKYSCLFKCSI